MTDAARNPHPDAVIVRANVDRVRANIAKAAHAAGRDPAGITLVGVTKSVDSPLARLLLDAGVADLAENRPESLVGKAAEPGLAAARWHLIGTYQRRKVRDTLGPISVIHSIHSEALAIAVSERAEETERTIDSFLQIKIADEPTKQGFDPSEVHAAWRRLRGLRGIHWIGVMTMAPLNAPDDVSGALFTAVRNIRDAIAQGTGALPHLSIGMSSDYEVAIAKGATMVRIGTALFEGAGGARAPAG